MNVREYAAQIAKDAGLQDDTAKAFIESFSNEKVSKAFEERMLARDEFSRQLDSVTAEKKRLNGWYEEQLRVAQNNEKIVNEANARLKQYQETYGDLDGGAKPVVDTSQFIDKKTLEDALNKKDQQFIGLLKTVNKCSADYMKRFGDVLDTDALEKFTLESGLPLQAAYEKFIQPKVDEIKTKDFDDKLKKAREEGMQEGISQAKNPTHPGNPEPNGFIANLRTSKQTSSTAREGFVDSWNKATAQ
jgi:phosphorylcholine metabolism protein LicD